MEIGNNATERALHGVSPSRKRPHRRPSINRIDELLPRDFGPPDEA